MKCRFTHEELETHASGLLDEARAAELEEHLAGCDHCRDELDWLRLEQAAFTSREADATTDAAELWRGIEEQLGQPAATDEGTRSARNRAISPAPTTKQRAVWFGSGFAAAAMAAAVLLFYVQVPQVAQPELTPAPSDAAVPTEDEPKPAEKPEDPGVTAIDRAEAEYTEAIEALETEYHAKRSGMPPEIAAEHERVMSESRQLINKARTDAGDDIDARMQVLDAYSSHLRTVQAVIADLDPS